MSDKIVFDPTDTGTLRPNEAPLLSAGKEFEPMELPDFTYKICLPNHISPDDPITLFTMYYTPEIIDWIVVQTNNHIRLPKDLASSSSRVDNWFPTWSSEIYTYLAIRIYMTTHVENEISDYWKVRDITPIHPITKYMTRNRFQELHIRFRLAGSDAIGPFQRIRWEKLSNHFQNVNLSVWIPGRDVVVDEIMVRYQGRARQTTTIPNKPTPTGFKVWAVAQQGFLICWNWHIPGEKNGPVGVKTPRELGGSKKEGKGGNKTQAVVIHLLQRLPQPPFGYSYHCYLDNLFVSTRLVAYARRIGFGVTGTCRTNSGIIKDLIQLKASDKDDHMAWGTVYSFTTPDGLISQVGWKDQAFVLMMSSLFSGKEAKVLRLRKRPKETSSKAKTSRAAFGGQSEKELLIPAIADSYNYGMGGVDEFDQLAASNAGLRRVKRGGHQAIDHWLLRTVLTYCYTLTKRSKVLFLKNINLRSQADFRDDIIKALLEMGKDQLRSSKKRVAIVDLGADSKDPTLHQVIKMVKPSWCVACKGARFEDRPTKRVALSVIATNKCRHSINHQTIYGCLECNVHLCRNKPCFAIFHGIR